MTGNWRYNLDDPFRVIQSKHIRGGPISPESEIVATTLTKIEADRWAAVFNCTEFTPAGMDRRKNGIYQFYQVRANQKYS